MAKQAIVRLGTRDARRPGVCAEPLEQRVLMAMSLALGGSGFSNLLASDTLALHKQKLVIDPPEPLAGSASVLYDAAKVTLVGATPGPGYENASFGGFVEIRVGNDARLQDLAGFLRQPAGIETGYAQVRFLLTGKPDKIAPPRNWIVWDVGGTEGLDPYALDFEIRPDVSSDNEFKYRVYAAKQGEHSGNAEDFLITNDGTRTRIGPDRLSSAEATTRPKDGSVSGTVFEDVNGDREHEPTEPVMGGVTLFIDVNRDGKLGVGEPSTVSNELGGYFFDNLAPGDYIVREVTPKGYQQTFNLEVTGWPVRIEAGKRTRSVNFGNARPATISGTVFNDLNGDGLRGAAEPGLAGAAVYLDLNNNAIRDTGEPSATSSGAGGAWSMATPLPGTYVVRHVPPAGYIQTFPRSSSQSVTVTSGGTAVGVTFGDRTAPRVVEAFVRGSAWSSSFQKQLASQNLGGEPVGIRISSGAAALTVLPWVNIDQVIIRFDQAVTVDAADLVIHGVRADYASVGVAALTGFPDTYVFTLNRPLGGDGSAALNGDRLTLDLDGDPPNGVTLPGNAGALMDGDVDGTPGGDYRRSFTVLQGDADRSGRVTVADTFATLRSYNSIAGLGRYSIYRDVNGSGAVNGSDVVLVRNRLGRFLPAVQAPASATTALPLRPSRRSLFGETILLA